jgi:transcriptional regulator with XRE-family HTH domain
MGQASRPRPSRLARKLADVRAKLGLSQNELISRMGVAEEITQARISAYERGVREPPLTVLLKYARLSGVYVEVLIDDELELPERLPGPVRHEAVMRPFAPRRRSGT